MAQIMGRRRRRPSFSIKTVPLFILPIPLLIKAITALWTGDFAGMIAGGSAFLMFLGGALMTRQGLAREADYLSRAVARAPKLPAKAIGGGLTALATAFTAYAAAGHGVAISGSFGLAALAGYFLFYGFDPKGAKGEVDGYGPSVDEVAEILDEAYAKLDKIEASSRNIRSPEFNARLANIRQQARKVLAAIEEDPRDLRRARKFLNVYLDGAQKVTDKYARTHQKTASPVLEENFRELLVNMENVFAEQHEKLLENDVLDLDVQIEVLTTQLKREGVI